MKPAARQVLKPIETPVSVVAPVKPPAIGRPLPGPGPGAGPVLPTRAEKPQPEVAVPRIMEPVQPLFTPPTLSEKQQRIVEARYAPAGTAAQESVLGNWMRIVQVQTAPSLPAVEAPCFQTASREEFQSIQGAPLSALRKESLSIAVPASDLVKYLPAIEQLKALLLANNAQVLMVTTFNSRQGFKISWRRNPLVDGNDPSELASEKTVKDILNKFSSSN